jgi:RNA recognition motif-containing protein
MGFGFVNFETNESALSAMNAMNGAQLPQGKIMKISLARPAWKANIHSNVYVSGLPAEFSDEDVKNLFIEYLDEIENIRRLRDSRGVFRGIAVIRFDREELAQDAMKKLHGLMLPNCSSPVQVRPWRPEFRPERIDASFASSKSLSPTPSPSYATLTTPSPSGYNKLSPLSPSTPPRMEGWQEIWSRYVESQMKQQSFLTMPVTPSPQLMTSTRSSAAAPSLFVFHLPPDANESTLRVLFEPYGPVSSVRVLPGKGYGFVNFEDMQSALTAIHSLNGFKLGNKHLKVEFKKPSPTGIPA